MKSLDSKAALDCTPKDDFFRALEEVAAMQQVHGDLLQAGSCNDIFAWGQDRDRVFRGLVRALDAIKASEKGESDYLDRVCAAMEKLLADEALLCKQVAARQEKIHEQLHAMRKGKEVLHGYSVNKGLVPQPRYFSNRM